jgi:NADPH:quinone reductase-like Zn-dependent oxidoreductase
MKAIRIHARGGPEHLVFEDVPRPVPGAGDALVRVHAVAISPTELAESATRTRRDDAPRLPAVPGHELSGVVEAIASDVTGVAVGDAVYALTDFSRDGAAAEYVAVRAASLAPKPFGLDHVQAAGVPLSALTAWQAFFTHAGLTGGQRVLVHGAAGGVGTFAVQLARWRGAHVIGTASRRNVAFLEELGANEVVDCTEERFEDRIRDVDIVLDAVGGDTLERSWGVLRQGGTLVSIAGRVPDTPAALGVRGVFFVVEPSRAQLVEIASLLDAGVVRPIVEAVFPLARAREAYELGLTGRTRGKLVLRVLD